MRTLNLDILKAGLPGITPSQGGYYLEAAIVCLVNQGFHSGVVLKVEGDIEEECTLGGSRIRDAKI